MGNSNKKYKVLVTAGPTREPLDPVRYLSNLSTGMMGYEIATESVKRGHEVCLVTGPVNITPPQGIDVINVTTALEMRDEVLKHVDEADCLIMTAAVCDFRPEKRSEEKIKKGETLDINFVKNPDILLEIKDKKDLVKVGFALESQDAAESGKDKLKEKNLDLIFINTVTESSSPFGACDVDYTMLTPAEETKNFIGITKKEMAREILDEIEKLS